MIAARVVLSGRIGRQERLAKRIPRQLARVHGSRRDPGLRFWIEDVDLVQPVIALHVVPAEDVNTAVGERDARVAIRVVEETPGIPFSANAARFMAKSFSSRRAV